MGARGRKSASELSLVRLQPDPDLGSPAGSRPEPPSHLSSSTKDWWRTTVRDYDLEPHHLRLLQGAAESWDRYQQARVALAKHGLTFEDDKGMVRARPEVAIERDSRIAFARLIRELDLD